MCVVSQIMDYGRTIFPQPPHQWPPPSQTWPNLYAPPNQTLPAPALPAPLLPSPEEMKRWIESFRALVAAGEEFDRVTGQPDCVDPEKEALMGRVAELEERLKALEEDAGQS